MRPRDDFHPTSRQRRAAFLGGVYAEATRSTAAGPLNRELRDEWETGRWAVRHGYIRLTPERAEARHA